jgi:outer membrane protein assembly factor BamB
MILLSLCSVLFSGTSVLPGDWPQYHGSSGDRNSREEISLKAWPESGPPALWKVDTETGFSSFTVSDQRAFTLVERDGLETIVALNIEDGEELWATPVGETTYDGGGDAGASDNKGGDGPRSTPSIDGELVYVFDGSLRLHCFDVKTGNPRWSRDVTEEFEGQELKWQNAASPLVEGDFVFVCGGGKDRAFLAFEKTTGELAWSTGEESMTHATPVAATIHGVRQIIFFVQSGLVSLDQKSGEELWRAEYRYQVSTAASPVVYEDTVYVSAGYGVGAGAYRINKTSSGMQAELLWQKRNDLMNHWSTPVCRDGFLYGMFSFKKYGEGPLCCVNIESGELAWSVPGFGPGNAIAVGETLVALSDAGELVLVELTPTKYTELSRAQVVEGKCWSSPSFAAGSLFVRSTEQGARIDLR